MGLGRILFAIGFAALGAFTIGWHGFAAEWLSLPKGAAWHDVPATLSGAILVAGGVALLVPRTARLSSLVLAGFLLVPLLLRIHT